MNRRDGNTTSLRVVFNDSCSSLTCGFASLVECLLSSYPGILQFSDLLWVTGGSVLRLQTALLNAPGWVVLKSVAAGAFVLSDPPFHIFSRILPVLM